MYMIALFLFSVNTILRPNTDYWNSRIALPEKTVYSIQVASFPAQSKAAVLALYDSLKQYGELVYYEKVRIDKKGEWIRVKIGMFESYELAGALEGKLIHECRQDAFITKSTLLIRRFGDDFAIKTPNALWAKLDGKFVECFNFGEVLFYTDKGYHNWADYTQPFFTPDKKQLIYEFDNKIYLTDTDSLTITILNIKNAHYNRHIGIVNSVPQMSPSGKYIAFISDNLWESESHLWLYSKDSTYKIVNATSSLSVKNFRWHPQQDIIFYVFGFPFGTISVGGDIYATDTMGNQVKLIKSYQKINEEISMDIEIDEEYLYYKNVYFSESGGRIAKIVEKKAKLDSLLTVFNSKIK